MHSFYEEWFKVHTYDADFKNQLKINSIFNMMQDIASRHAEELGVGWKDLQSSGLFWALSWVKIEFSDYPKFEDSIKIKTWPKGKYRLFALRDFIMSDDKNNIFCRAATAWLLVNVKSKRVNDLKNLPKNIPYLSGEHALTDLPEKITLENRKENIFKKHVVYTDIDLNLHVNNEKYIEFILNCYSLEYHSENNIKSLQVSFLSETKCGDNLEIDVNKISPENETHFVEALNLNNNNKQVFNAIVEWKKIAL
jgi:acyl-ACP thioesterase